jgi:coiled-coil domain-containing protein 55
MTHFYRKLLEESEQNHEATVAATQKRIIGPQGPTPNLTITKPADFAPLSDLDLARLARAEGKDVELNDDNQIVDKRELLAAGLNLSAPNTRRLGTFAARQGSTATKEGAQTHRAAGTAATRKEINDRRIKEIQQQLIDEEDRVLRERQKADQDAIQRTVAKRNTESDIDSARERYLQRKRQNLMGNSKETDQEP